MQLITTFDAAKRIYTTPYTVRKYIRQGKLNAVLIGKQYLIKEDDLTAFVESFFQSVGDI